MKQRTAWILPISLVFAVAVLLLELRGHSSSGMHERLLLVGIWVDWRGKRK